MAIATLANYQSALQARLSINVVSISTSQNSPGPISTYTFTRSLDGTLGSAPGAAATCTKSSAFALNAYVPSYSNGTYIVGSRVNTIANTGTGSGSLMLIDRLCHSSGLDGTVTTAQTTNLPSAALPRFTSGVGVMAALECYALAGTTATTFTVSYTNEQGVSGCVSPAALFPASSTMVVGKLLFVPLASGDKGIRSVESVTLAGSTGAAGNFGVTLFRPLSVVACSENGVGFQAISDVTASMPLGLPAIDNACLQIVNMMLSVNLGHLHGSLLYGVGA